MTHFHFAKFSIRHFYIDISLFAKKNIINKDKEINKLKNFYLKLIYK